MKRILFLTCIGSLTLALTTFGAHKGKSAQRAAGGHGTRSAHVVSRGGGGGHQLSHHVGRASSSRHFATRQGHSLARASHNSRSRHLSMAQIHRNARATPVHARVATNGVRSAARTHNERGNRATSARAGTTRTEQANASLANRGRNAAQARTLQGREANVGRTGRAQAAQTNVANAARNNLAANRGRNMTLGTNHLVNYNGENVRIVNDWHDPRFRGNPNYAAFYNYDNNYEWHDRW
jgi:hypothetical protein